MNHFLPSALSDAATELYMHEAHRKGYFIQPVYGASLCLNLIRRDRRRTQTSPYYRGEKFTFCEDVKIMELFPQFSLLTINELAQIMLKTRGKP
jgi:hypothetical protein